MTSWQEAKKLVLDTALEICRKGLVVGNSGNISVRLPPTKGNSGNISVRLPPTKGKSGLMAITPTSRHYDTLAPGDIPVIDFEGNKVEGNLEPSIETPLHIAIYRARKNVNAVIHTHSTYASAAGIAGKDIPAILLDQVICLGGEIKRSNGPLVTTTEQIADFVRALGDRSAVLIPNHGSVGTGKTMRDALTACEILEKTAQVYLLALASGNVNLLPEDVYELEKSAYDRLQSDNK